MKKPSSRDAWIGVAGVIGGAVVAGLFSLVPWYFSEPDPITELRNTIQAGISGLVEIDDPQHRLRQIDKLAGLLETDPVMHYGRVIGQFRKITEDQLQEIAVARADAAAATEQGGETGQETGSIAAEEAERIAAANRAAAEKVLALDQGREAELAEQQARLVALQQQLADERLCRDEDCTSWILR